MNDSDMKLYERLRRAVADCDLGKVRKQLEAGAPVNLYLANSKIHPPLHEAACRGFMKGLECLHAHGAQLDLPGVERATALAVAADHGEVEAGRWLLRQGADPRLKRWPGKSPLRIALLQGNLSFASMMIDERPDLREDELVSISKWLIEYSQNIDIAKWMLNAGVNPNTCSETGRPWLMIMQGREEAIARSFTDLLLSHGVDVNRVDTAGSTALHENAISQRTQIAMKLLVAGANPDIVNRHKETARSIIMKKWRAQEIADFQALEASNAARQIVDQPLAGNAPKPL